MRVAKRGWHLGCARWRGGEWYANMQAQGGKAVGVTTNTPRRAGRCVGNLRLAWVSTNVGAEMRRLSGCRQRKLASEWVELQRLGCRTQLVEERAEN